MSEMVERAAKAICEADGRSWDGGRWPHCEMYRSYVRTALAAMREPTDAMLESGDGSFERDEDSSGNYRIYSADAGKCWQAMIDAALASNEPQAG